MATNGKHNLIGYDPLAWMGEEPDIEALIAIEQDDNNEMPDDDSLAEADLIGLDAVNEDLAEDLPEVDDIESNESELIENLQSNDDVVEEAVIEHDMAFAEDDLGGDLDVAESIDELPVIDESELAESESIDALDADDEMADELVIEQEMDFADDDLLELDSVNEELLADDETELNESELIESLDSNDDVTDESVIEHDMAFDEEIMDSGDEAMSVEMVADDLDSEQIDSEMISAESSIQLESNLTIQHVVKLHESFKASLSAFEQITIDASAVSSIDTATLQLLVALKKEAEKSQKQVEISSASPRFVESARLLGLAEVLNVDL